MRSIVFKPPMGVAPELVVELTLLRARKTTFFSPHLPQVGNRLLLGYHFGMNTEQPDASKSMRYPRREQFSAVLALPADPSSGPQEIFLQLQHLSRETKDKDGTLRGGLLLGQYCKSQTAPHSWVEVLDYFQASQGILATASTLTFTHEFWAHAHAEIDSRTPATAILGWYLIRPDSKLEFPDQNKEIQKRFFDDVYHVHLVASNSSSEARLFWYPGGARSGSDPQAIAFKL